MQESFTLVESSEDTNHMLDLLRLVCPHLCYVQECVCVCVSHRAGCCCIGSCRGSLAAEPSPGVECVRRLSGPDEQDDKHNVTLCLLFFCLSYGSSALRRELGAFCFGKTHLILVRQQVAGVRLQFDEVRLKVLDLDGAEGDKVS